MPGKMSLELVLSNYILTGRLGNNEVGRPVQKVAGDWIESTDRHECGLPVFYKWEWAGIPINVVVDNYQAITALVLHLRHWEKPVRIQEGNCQLTLSQSTSLDDLLRFLNQAGIEWQFHFIFEKVVIVQLANSRVQFVFSYYPGESNELQIIQTGGGS